MHLDPEIVYFLFTVAIFLILGIPRIRRSVWLPRELQFQDVPQQELTAEQTKYVGSYDQKVAELGVGYYPFKTYRVPNMLGHNLIRVYLSSTDPAKCVLVMVASKGKGLFSSYTEFASMYADGSRLVINNNSTTGIFDDMPGAIAHRYKGLTDLTELKRRHDAEAEKLRPRGIVFYNASNYFEDFRQYHLKYCEYQTSKDLLRWDPKSKVYRATTRTALRGVRNFINPLAHNSSFLRFVAGVALGGGLPIMAAMWRASILLWVSAHTSADAALTGRLFPIFVYGIAGVSVGLLFSRRTFIWGFLLGVLPTRLFLGVGEAGYGLWMAAIADLTGRVHNRSKNIL